MWTHNTDLSSEVPEHPGPCHLVILSYPQIAPLRGHADRHSSSLLGLWELGGYDPKDLSIVVPAQ